MYLANDIISNISYSFLFVHRAPDIFVLCTIYHIRVIVYISIYLFVVLYFILFAFVVVKLQNQKKILQNEAEKKALVAKVSFIYYFVVFARGIWQGAKRPNQLFFPI